MEEDLRVLMIAAQPDDSQRIEQLLAEARETGRLPVLQVKYETAPDVPAAAGVLSQGLLDAVFLTLSTPEDLPALAELCHTHPDLPIIVCVNAADEALALSALPQGATDYWLKDRCRTQDMAAIFRHVLDTAQLKSSRQRLNWLEEGISEVIWRARPDLHWVEVTASIQRLTGYSVEEALDMSLVDFIAPVSHPALLAALQTTPLYQPVEDDSFAAGSAVQPLTLELEHLRKNGEKFWAEVKLRVETDASGQAIGAQGITRDVSERHAIQQRLDIVTLRDPLTGLFNRVYLEEEINRLEFSRLYPITILMADFEGLNGINNDHGPEAGDEMLKRVADLLRAAFRSEDMISRMSGNDFVVLMPQAHPRAAGRALQRVLNLVNAYNQGTPALPLNITMEVVTAEPGQSLVRTFKAAHGQKSNKKAIS